MRPPTHFTRYLSLMGLSLAIMLVMTACDVHEFPGNDIPDDLTVNSRVILEYQDLDMPLYTTVTYDPTAGRSLGDALLSRHIIRVYNASSSSRSDRTEVASVTITGSPHDATARRQVDISLPPGTYRYIAWSDYSVDGGNTYYDPGDFAEISLVSTLRGDLLYHQADTPWRDAFRGEGTFTVGSDGLMYDDAATSSLAEAVIPMRRPLARFEFVTTDLDKFVQTTRSHHSADSRDGGETAPGYPLPSINPADYRILFRYVGYMPCALNNFTDKPVNSITSAAFTGSIAPVSGSGSEATLGADYVFTNGSETSVMVVLDIYDNTTGKRVASTDPITVPLIRNRLTIVRGNFLTCGTGSNIGINPGFNGDINIEIR